MATPWLVPSASTYSEDQLWGYVLVSEDRPGFYWTGSQGDAAWSANPWRALVDAVVPWDMFGSPVKGGRCVKVLLENEVTMLRCTGSSSRLTKESALVASLCSRRGLDGCA